MEYICEPIGMHTRRRHVQSVFVFASFEGNITLGPSAALGGCMVSPLPVSCQCSTYKSLQCMTPAVSANAEMIHSFLAWILH